MDGLRKAEGNVPEPGVCRLEEQLVVLLLSMPAAAIVADTAADAMAILLLLERRELLTRRECKEDGKEGEDTEGLCVLR